jgi:hypothetical protein
MLHFPAGRNVEMSGPERALPRFVDQDTERALIVVEWVVHAVAPLFVLRVATKYRRRELAMN